METEAIHDWVLVESITIGAREPSGETRIGDGSLLTGGRERTTCASMWASAS